MDDRFYAKGEDPSNKSAGWLEFKKRFFRDFVNIQLPCVWIFIPPTIVSLSGVSSETRKLIWEAYTPYYNIYAIPGNKGLQARKPTSGDYILPVILSGVYSWSAYMGIKDYLEYSSVLKNLALRMADLQRLVHTVGNIDAIIRANPALEKLYNNEITGIRTLLARANESTEIGRLIDYLQKLPFKNWSYFFNNAGKLLASHKLFIEHKQIFDDAMYELGLLDAYLSFAILVQESKEYDSQNHYTFVELLSHTQHHKPYIKIVGMWNPFLDAKQAVANDIEMNGEKNNVRTIILTGPNAGGKSIFLTGVTHSILLAQVMGIAPAQQAILTPFNKINTYIDITDDVATGKSLFMAEVDRAQQHIKTLKGLQENEFSFTIFDEPFSGTNPIEGAAAEYSILESLANYTNSLTVVATHYPIVMLLEAKAPNKGFINYKVYITRDPLTKKIQYSYKIVPGRSTQAIAIDILEEQGYDTSMLKRARDIIEHPERYEATFTTD
jgi:DNA mismatch repair protein MutS